MCEELEGKALLTHLPKHVEYPHLCPQEGLSRDQGTAAFPGAALPSRKVGKKEVALLSVVQGLRRNLTVTG